MDILISGSSSIIRIFGARGKNSSLCLRRHRQIHLEGAANSRLAVYFYPALVAFDYTTAHRKPQTSTLAHALRGKERVEYAAHVLFGYAAAVVSDLYTIPAALNAGPYLYHPAARDGLHRVQYEVHDNLLYLVPVGHYGRQALGKLRGKVYIPALDRVDEQRYEPIYDGVHIRELKFRGVLL